MRWRRRCHSPSLHSSRAHVMVAASAFAFACANGCAESQPWRRAYLLTRRQQSQTIASQPFGCKFIFSSNRLSGFHHLTNARIRTTVTVAARDAKEREYTHISFVRIHELTGCVAPLLDSLYFGAHTFSLASSRHASNYTIQILPHCRRAHSIHLCFVSVLL